MQHDRFRASEGKKDRVRSWPQDRAPDLTPAQCAPFRRCATNSSPACASGRAGSGPTSTTWRAGPCPCRSVTSAPRAISKAGTAKGPTASFYRACISELQIAGAKAPALSGALAVAAEPEENEAPGPWRVRPLGASRQKVHQVVARYRPGPGRGSDACGPGAAVGPGPNVSGFVNSIRLVVSVCTRALTCPSARFLPHPTAGSQTDILKMRFLWVSAPGTGSGEVQASGGCSLRVGVWAREPGDAWVSSLRSPGPAGPGAVSGATASWRLHSARRGVARPGPAHRRVPASVPRPGATARLL